MSLAEAKFSPIDILINNAANDKRHSLDSLSPEDWDDAFNVNLKPHFFSAQYATLHMIANKQGCIINMGSNSALLGLTGYPAYVSAKAGIIGLTKALARELGPHNIRVNALIPGWVLTERQREEHLTPEALAECLAQQSLKSTIEEADISNAALFLASQASAMMTGQAMVIDGGRA